MVSVPLPHTAVISQPRNLEVHINFNGLDHVLGAHLPSIHIICSPKICMLAEKQGGRYASMRPTNLLSAAVQHILHALRWQAVACTGQTLVPSSSDGRVTVVELWLCTDSSAEADSVEKALKRLQLRIYPDIVAFGQAYAAYSQMYEQCKADQIDACTQYSNMYLAVQVWPLQPLSP